MSLDRIASQPASYWSSSWTRPTMVSEAFDVTLIECDRQRNIGKRWQHACIVHDMHHSCMWWKLIWKYKHWLYWAKLTIQNVSSHVRIVTWSHWKPVLGIWEDFQAFSPSTHKQLRTVKTGLIRTHQKPAIVHTRSIGSVYATQLFFHSSFCYHFSR